MANSTINGLTETTAPAANDQFVVWSTSANGTRKLKGENLDKLVFRSRAAATATTGKSLPILSYTGGVPVVENLPFSTLVNDFSTLVNQVPPSQHTHDERYYTESEVDEKLLNKQAAGNYVVNQGGVSAIQVVSSMPAVPSPSVLYVVIS